MSVMVIGNGEMGHPISELVKKAVKKWYLLDKGQNLMDGWLTGSISSSYFVPEVFLAETKFRKCPIQFLHICFPEQPQFVQKVIEYIKIYKPRHVIIHSTTMPGVCVKIQNLIEPEMPETLIYSSPIRGNIRDGMMEGLLGYWKYLAPARWDQISDDHVDYIPEDKPRVKEAVDHLTLLGMHVREHPCATDLEWAKILDLGFYGVALAYYQTLERFVERARIDYDIIREFIETTPEQSGGKAQRIVFYGGYIGGHCVVPALERLSVIEKASPTAPGDSLFRAALESNAARLVELIDHKPNHHP